VDAREDLALDEKIERAEHGRAPHATRCELTDEILRGERLLAAERSGDDRGPRARATPSVTTELGEYGTCRRATQC
jgi:hypothetical protein